MIALFIVVGTFMYVCIACVMQGFTKNFYCTKLNHAAKQAEVNRRSYGTVDHDLCWLLSFISGMFWPIGWIPVVGSSVFRNLGSLFSRLSRFGGKGYPAA